MLRGELLKRLHYHNSIFDEQSLAHEGLDIHFHEIEMRLP
jgi:hypothetical protein